MFLPARAAVLAVVPAAPLTSNSTQDRLAELR
jgi:hypothetical protein